MRFDLLSHGSLLASFSRDVLAHSRWTAMLDSLVVPVVPDAKSKIGMQPKLCVVFTG
jgi:hypothetical protein